MLRCIVIDGPPLSGKTSLLEGEERDGVFSTHFDCLKDRGYLVVPETAHIFFNQYGKK